MALPAASATLSIGMIIKEVLSGSETTWTLGDATSGGITPIRSLNNLCQLPEGLGPLPGYTYITDWDSFPGDGTANPQSISEFHSARRDEPDV